MGGQLDRNFLAGSLPHKFIILIVTSFICLWSINFFPLSLCPYLPARLSVCLSVCLSQTVIASKQRDGSSRFLAFPPIPHCGVWKFRICKNEGISIWNFVYMYNCGLYKICHCNSDIYDRKSFCVSFS